MQRLTLPKRRADGTEGLLMQGLPHQWRRMPQALMQALQLHVQGASCWVTNKCIQRNQVLRNESATKWKCCRAENGKGVSAAQQILRPSQRHTSCTSRKVTILF